jgi:hypothetical protein
VPSYLTPYVEARRRHKSGVRSLLWEDRRAQEVRFAAILRNCPLGGLHVLDVGCGRGDLLRYLETRDVFPARYTGIEAHGAGGPFRPRSRRTPSSLLVADFVETPDALRVGADAVVFSGSLNLLTSRQFYGVLNAAWAATRQWLVFNFLDSPALAGAAWLKWHRRCPVLGFAERSARFVAMDRTYEEGDCTVVMRK